MKHNFLIASFTLGVLAMSGAASAATFTPTFDTPTFPGSQFSVDTGSVYNDYYNDNFGIEVSNSYLYVDNRDTFDGIGIANGLVENIGSVQSGRIDFLDTTDFVDLDWVAFGNGGGIFEAYDSIGVLLSSFDGSVGEGTTRLDGGIISYITFTGNGGFSGISSLTYNFDGTTDGTNTDLTPVPLPASGLLLVAALGGLGAMRRRKA